MKDSKWKARANTQGVFSKIKAVFSATQATADDSELSQSSPGYIPFEEVGAYQSEAEHAMAQAQEMAERIRRRIL